MPGKMNRAATADSTKPGETQVEERDDRHQRERNPLARMDRQRLDVEDVDHQQHGEQDQLAPLGVVAEEEPHVLEQELALLRRQPVQQGGGGAAERPAHLPRGALLRLRVAQEKQLAVHRRPRREREQARAPQLDDRPRVRDPGEPVHDHLGCPLARQPRARRRLQHRQVVQEVLEPLRPGEPLGPDEAQHEHHRGHRSQAHQPQQLARPAGGEDVHQQHREDRAGHGRKREIGHHRGHRHERKERPAGEHHAVGGEDRAAPAAPPSTTNARWSRPAWRGTGGTSRSAPRPGDRDPWRGRRSRVP